MHSAGKQLPSNAIIFTMVAAASPDTAMFPVEVNSIDRPAAAIFKTEGIAHLPEFFSYPVRRTTLHHNAAGFWLAIGSLFAPQ